MVAAWCLLGGWSVTAAAGLGPRLVEEGCLVSVGRRGGVGLGGWSVTAAAGLGPRLVEEGRSASVRPEGEVGPGE